MSDMSANFAFDVQELKKLLAATDTSSSSAGLGGAGIGAGGGGMDMLEQLAFEMKLKQQQAAAVQALRNGVQPNVLLGGGGGAGGTGNSMRGGGLDGGMFGEQQHHGNGLESHSVNSLSQLLNGTGNGNGNPRSLGGGGGAGGGGSDSMDAYRKLAAVAAELRSSAANNNSNGGGMDPRLHSLMSKFKNDEILEMLAQKQARDQQQQQAQQQQHHMMAGLGNGQGPQPITKGRQIVKQNNLWNTEPSNGSGMMTGGGGGVGGGGSSLGMKTSIPPPSMGGGNRNNMTDIGHFVLPPVKNYRNGGEESSELKWGLGSENRN